MKWFALAALTFAALPVQAQPFGGQPPVGGPGGFGRPGVPQIGGIGAGQPAGPTFSPYLNLLNGRGNNTNPAINYLGLVRPQQEFRNNLQSLQTQVTDQQLVTGQMSSLGSLGTGSRTRFMNTGGYFLNLAGGTTTPGATGAGGLAGPNSLQLGTSNLRTGLATDLGAPTRGRR